MKPTLRAALSALCLAFLTSGILAQNHTYSTSRPSNQADSPKNSGSTDDIIEAKTYSVDVPIEAPSYIQTNDDDNKIYDSVDQEPIFPGGKEALLKYVANHIQYPQLAAENDIQGKVTVQFVVTKTGTIGKVRVVRGKDPELDKEAVRVIKTLPRFTPGKKNGQPVNVWFTFPITFRLGN